MSFTLGLYTFCPLDRRHSKHLMTLIQSKEREREKLQCIYLSGRKNNLFVVVFFLPNVACDLQFSSTQEMVQLCQVVSFHCLWNTQHMYLTTIQSLNLSIQELPCKYNFYLQQRYRSLKVAELAKCNKYYHHAKFDIYHYTFNTKLAQLNSGHRQNVGTYPGGTYIDSLLFYASRHHKNKHIYMSPTKFFVISQ